MTPLQAGAAPWRVSLFAMVLAAAGLPVYILLPRYATVDMGLDLATVGAILLGIRILDVVQDPALGRLIDGWRGGRDRLALIGLGVMAAGFVMLFSIPAPVDPRLWLVLSLVLVFSGHSLASILLYGDSEALAGSASPEAQLRLSTWREAGGVLGVIVAVVAPASLPGSLSGFGWALAALAVLAVLATRRIWSHAPRLRPAFALAPLLRSGGGWLLGLAVINSLPVAITSTLFVFFVEDHLRLTGQAGPFLLLFFAGAGASLPAWSALARRRGARPVLLSGMLLAVISFVWAGLVPPGAAIGFGLISMASGIAIGADLVILPAVFASLLGRSGLAPNQSFGLWSFANKLSLPLAAATVLPALQASGFVAGQANSAAADVRLVLLYALVPCGLKLIAGGILLAMPRHIWAAPEPIARHPV